MKQRENAMFSFPQIFVSNSLTEINRLPQMSCEMVADSCEIDNVVFASKVGSMFYIISIMQFIILVHVFVNEKVAKFRLLKKKSKVSLRQKSLCKTFTIIVQSVSFSTGLHTSATYIRHAKYCIWHRINRCNNLESVPLLKVVSFMEHPQTNR